VVRGCRPQRHRSWYSTFPPFPDTCPRNQPTLGQTGVRGANVNCRAWLTDDSNRSTGGRFRPQAWLPLSAVSDNCLGTHQQSAVWPRRRVVLQRQTQIVCRYSTPPACTAQAATRRHFAIRSQRRARSARYKDGSSGGAASSYNNHSVKCTCVDSGFIIYCTMLCCSQA